MDLIQHDGPVEDLSLSTQKDEEASQHRLLMGSGIQDGRVPTLVPLQLRQQRLHPNHRSCLW